LGKLEKLILLNIANFHKEKNQTIALRHRFNTGSELVALVYVRNRIFKTHHVTASNKSSFSRALQRLEDKGLIKTMNKITYARYRTHAYLTEEGERLTLTNMFLKLTSISSNGTVSREEGT